MAALNSVAGGGIQFSAQTIEGAVVTSTVANMMNRDHMRAFLQRAAALAAFVALL
nr:hypothetical protein [Thioclava sp.]